MLVKNKNEIHVNDKLDATVNKTSLLRGYGHPVFEYLTNLVLIYFDYFILRIK